VNYQEQLKKYLEDLASSKPAPGGGSASALVGALAASLVSMVANFTVGKEKFKEVEEEIKKVLEISERLRKELLELMDKDIEAYGEFSRALKLPQKTEEEKRRKKKAIEEAIEKATQIPYQIMEKGREILKLNEILLKKGNPRLLSDVKVSSELALASLLSAYFNVEINLPYLPQNRREYFQNTSRFLIAEAKELKKKLERNEFSGKK